MQEHDVVAIGNALVDIIGHCDEAFLARHGRTKGSMQLVDAPTVEALYAAMGPAVEISGGSAANTAAGVASFGGKAGFIGKTATDQFGQVFRHDIRAAGVTFDTPPAGDGEPTGRSLILVTPDGQRTMNTFLGVSPQLGSGEVDAAADPVGAHPLPGGLPVRPPRCQGRVPAGRRHRRQGRAAGGAHPLRPVLRRPPPARVPGAGAQVRGHPVRQRDRDRLALRDPSFDEAAGRAQADTRLAALTRSEKGSVILSAGKAIEIPAAPVDKVVDTTGAGDLYAAGFLFGVARDLPLETAGRLGSLAAAEVISHIGARPQVPLIELARKAGLLA